jgi:signal transduction histidine kinase
MAEMIERHLQLQRLSHADFEPQRLPTPAAHPAEMALEAVTEAWPRRRFDTAGMRGGVIASMDAGLIELALSNLLVNAAKYSPADEAVGLEIVVAAGRLCYRVVDRGAGLPPAEQARLFRLYARSADATGDDGGFGIGLAMARRVAELHGGTLDYLREDGTTVFVLCLPVEGAGT